MQPGDLIFIRGTEGMAWPIKKITRSPYTHIAGIVLNDQVFEAQALRMTGHQPLESYKGVADVYTCPALTLDQRHAIVQAATQWMGTRYDYFLFGILAFRQILGDIVPLFPSKRRSICTTLWTHAYRAVGIELCPGLQCPTPGELAKSSRLEWVGSY